MKGEFEISTSVFELKQSIEIKKAIPRKFFYSIITALKKFETEVTVSIFEQDGEFKVSIPDMIQSRPASVIYSYKKRPSGKFIMQLHTHPKMGAFESSIDSRDWTSNASGFYGVVGEKELKVWFVHHGVRIPIPIEHILLETKEVGSPIPLIQSITELLQESIKKGEEEYKKELLKQYSTYSLFPTWENYRYFNRGKNKILNGSNELEDELELELNEEEQAELELLDEHFKGTIYE